MKNLRDEKFENVFFGVVQSWVTVEGQKGR
jgi:hypothetical protein